MNDWFIPGAAVVAALMMLAVIKMTYVPGMAEAVDRGQVFVCEPCEAKTQCACLQGMPASFLVGNDAVPVCLQCARSGFTDWLLHRIGDRAEVKAQALLGAETKG